MRISSRLMSAVSALALALGLAACSTMPLPEKQSVVIQISESDPAKWHASTPFCVAELFPSMSQFVMVGFTVVPFP